MVKIVRDYKNSSPLSNGRNNKKTEICIHETGNTETGTNANAHAKLQANGNPRNASWHYQVDDKQAIQSFGESVQCWHGGSNRANNNSIAVEICVNRDGDYNKAVLNALDLVVDIAKRNNISVSGVHSHNFYSGKNCPQKMMSEKFGWSVAKFKSEVDKKLTGSSSKPSGTSSSKSISTMASEVIKGNHGNGNSTRRKSLGVNKSVYGKVRKLVNERLSGKTSKPSVDYDKLVSDTIAGKYGNGRTRKRKLGKHFKEVQKRVNKKYR